MKSQTGCRVPVILALLAVTLVGEAQIPAPDSKKLFNSDRRSQQQLEQRLRREALATDKAGGDAIDVQAPTVRYQEDRGIIEAEGGVVASRGGVRALADRASVQVDKNVGSFEGDVQVSGDGFAIAAGRAEVDFSEQKGVFHDATVNVDEFGFTGRAERLEKVSETEFELFSCSFSSCDCPDGELPWLIRGSRGTIERDGYATVRDGVLEFQGVPMFYSPYFAFPAREDRTSGLLIPSIGISGEDGFEYRQPYYVVLDGSSDVLLTPFVATESRFGVASEYRNVFSERSSLTMGGVYSNESARGDDLRGTVTTGVSDPSIDMHRFGGWVRQSWRTESDVAVPSSLVTRVNVVSDNLMIRELDMPQLGQVSDRYTTSTALLRNSFGSSVTSELLADYNQELLSDQDQVLQRLPEWNLGFSRRFRPLGVTLASRGDMTLTHFDRDEGYDGQRLILAPRLALPLRYKNIVNSAFAVGTRSVHYSLSDTFDPSSGANLDSSDDRTFVDVGYAVSTAVERVYDVEEESLLSSFFAASKGNDPLVRVKHTIEPTVSYSYVPGTKQYDLPLFDSLDRRRRRSQVAYGFTSSLFGRFSPSRPGADEIEALTPRIEDLPSLDISRPISGVIEDFSELAAPSVVRSGEIRELIRLTMLQSYDADRDGVDQGAAPDDPADLPGVSDLSSSLRLYPTRYFGLEANANLRSTSNSLSSWESGFFLESPRGDLLRGRYSYVDESVSQLEGNAEVVIAPRLRTAGYVRWDELTSEIIESRVGLRVSGSCQCWNVDVAVGERTNPDKTYLLLGITLRGLGEFSQEIFSRSGDGTE